MPRTRRATALGKDFLAVTSKVNLNLAWDRLLRSDEAFYKWYWRDSAVAAGLARPEIIARISKELRNDQFKPDHACIISIPKKSGLLRHFAIVSFGDQLVFQAVMNLIAMRMSPRTKEFAGKSSFAYITREPKNKFFYTQWLEGYRQFNSFCVKAFNEGKHWYGGYDFASFYDSIDHKALSELLRQGFKVEEEVVHLLINMLQTWSATNGKPTDPLLRIELGHGIPQGPQPSGLLANAVLHYVDTHMKKVKNITYLRYADDIRIFAKTEKEVRAAAVRLDKLARNIGLFPQQAKFEVKELENVQEILKTVSVPDHREEELPNDEIEESSIEKLREIVCSKNLEDITKFKFLLSRATQNNDLAFELAALIEHRVDLTDVIARYLEKQDSLESRTFESVLNIIENYEPYPWVRARCIRAITQPGKKIEKKNKNRLKRWIQRVLPRISEISDAQLEAELMLAAVSYGVCSTGVVEDWASSSSTEWWSLKRFLNSVDEKIYGTAALNGLVQILLHHGNREVERAAAYRYAQLNLYKPGLSVDPDVRAIFAAAGLTTQSKSGSQRTSKLFRSLLVAVQLPSATIAIDWRFLLGSLQDYVDAALVRILATKDPNWMNFIMELDALLIEIAKKIQVTKGYHIPSRARTKPAYIFRESADFARDFPKGKTLICNVNELRGKCTTAHFFNDVNGVRFKTTRVYFRNIKTAIAELPEFLNELSYHYRK